MAGQALSKQTVGVNHELTRVANRMRCRLSQCTVRGVAPLFVQDGCMMLKWIGGVMDNKKRRVGTVPTFIRPMLCKAVGELPRGHEWVYEVKRGGKRTIAVKDHRRVKLFHENGLRLECPEVEQTVREIPVDSAVIDGEIISLNARAAPDPGHEEESDPPRLYAWDLLHLNGRDLTSQPVERRKQQLCTMTMDSALLFSPSLDCGPEELLEEVKRLSLEGVVAKRKGSTYEPGRCTGTWVKVHAAGRIIAGDS